MSGPDGLRGRLRVETAPDHERVDALAARFDLQDPDDYTAFLLAHAQALFPLEDALDRAGADRLLADWPERRRKTALRADLATLGVAAPATQSSPPALDEAEAWGTLYVLEGSRLGARLMLRTATAAADPDIRAATRFLAHGQGGRSWPGFLERLETEAQAFDDRRVLAGARTAFAVYAQAFGA